MDDCPFLCWDGSVFYCSQVDCSNKDCFMNDCFLDPEFYQESDFYDPSIDDYF